MKILFLLYYPLFFLKKLIKRTCSFFNKRFIHLDVCCYLHFKQVDFIPSKIKFKGRPYLRIENKSKVKFSDNFTCRSGESCIDNSLYSKIHVSPGASLSIGSNTGISNTTIYCTYQIEIGDYVNIGAGTLIIDSNFHSTNWKRRMIKKIGVKEASKAAVHIGNHVFIGTRCIITKGVTIGDKSIVAAGSVVVSDIPSGEVWGGNPAQFIRNI